MKKGYSDRNLEYLMYMSTIEFVRNDVESTVFFGEMVVQTVLYGIRVTPKDGGQPTVIRGRSLVVYIRDTRSPTGWYSLREMTQDGPPNRQ